MTNIQYESLVLGLKEHDKKPEINKNLMSLSQGYKVILLIDNQDADLVFYY